MNRSLGICLGASTASAVLLEKNGKNPTIVGSKRITHNGNPRETASALLAEFADDTTAVVFTGRKFRNLVELDTITEPQATESALEYLYPDGNDIQAVASLGGETFMVYTLDQVGKISDVITKNQCGGGTGEFYLQQIKRMDLSLEQANEISIDANPFKVSGRCSVFCKSDCTHALNKGTPKAEVSAGLAKMIADKIDELLSKKKLSKVLLAGGVTLNEPVMRFVTEAYNQAFTLPESANLEALGAAYYGLINETKSYHPNDVIFKAEESSFAFHKPLDNYRDKVRFESIGTRKANENEECVVGLDVGSTTTKAVAISLATKEILAKEYIYTNGNPIEAAKKCYKSIAEQLENKAKVVAIGTTGSGRHIAAIHAETTAVVNEISAHSSAAVFFDKDVDTIFEIGGQDAKYTYIVNQVPADYAMNEACSAGTGSFIEEAAWESLGVSVKDIERLALMGDNPPNFSDQCAAFIGSDIKTAQQENISKENILAGLVYSICLNYINRVKGNRTSGSKIFMQGGVCYNKAIPIAMAAISGKNIIVPPEPGLMGAFGVALETLNRLSIGLLQGKLFDLGELSNRDVSYHKPFVCAGGAEKCDLKCGINVIEVNGKKFPFGGACNKYYSLKPQADNDSSNYDYIERRNRLMFDTFAPEYTLPDSAISVGMNNSFNMFTIYPLLHNFFGKLGVKFIVPERADPKGYEREISSLCFPSQLSLATFQELLNLNPDFIFLPSILEMFTGETEEQRLDFNSSCVFVSGEPFYLKQAFKDYNLDSKIISPNLNFGNGFDKEEKAFVDLAKNIGIKDEQKAKDAYRFAVGMQYEYQQAAYKLGEEALRDLEQNPEEFGVVLVGRPYNSFFDLANKGIPRKFATRNVRILPFDIFDVTSESIDDAMYWESGKKILRIAKFVKKHDNLFATYISNFSCAPDSLIMNTFRTIMGEKPSLTLELDSHSADAGITTRIEAALDIIANYRKLNKKENTDSSEFRLAEIRFADPMAYFVDSQGKEIPLNSEEVEILIPSMGDISSKMFAASLRSLGFNAKAIEEPTPEVLKAGRSHSSGKECLPLTLMVGSLMHYLETNRDENKKIAFFTVQGAGNCRLGQYPVFIRDLLRRRRIPDVAQMVLMNEDGFAGLGENFALRGIQAIIAADVLDDVRNAILANAVDPIHGNKVFDIEFEELLKKLESNPEDIYKHLEVLAVNIKSKVPTARRIEESKYVAMLGEIYVRRDAFAHKSLNRTFAENGFVLKTAYISEWIFYVDYLLQIDLLESEKSLKKKLERQIRNFFMRDAEKKIKKTLEKSGYYKYYRTEIEPLLKHSKHLLPYEFKGEPGLTLGIALHEGLEKYCGIVNFGPFGCMPTRLSEAIALPEMNMEGKLRAKHLYNKDFQMSDIFNGHTNIPFLTIETDGNVYPQIITAKIETFMLQAERIADMMASAKTEKSNNGLMNKIKNLFD